MVIACHVAKHKKRVITSYNYDYQCYYYLNTFCIITCTLSAQRRLLRRFRLDGASAAKSVMSTHTQESMAFELTYLETQHSGQSYQLSLKLFVFAKQLASLRLLKYPGAYSQPNPLSVLPASSGSAVISG